VHGPARNLPAYTGLCGSGEGCFLRLSIGSSGLSRCLSSHPTRATQNARATPACDPDDAFRLACTRKHLHPKQHVSIYSSMFSSRSPDPCYTAHTPGSRDRSGNSPTIDCQIADTMAPHRGHSVERLPARQRRTDSSLEPGRWRRVGLACQHCRHRLVAVTTSLCSVYRCLPAERYAATGHQYARTA
jgi:hypothetical protein